jgi:gentisate 1,2-dioxygenase
VVISKETIDAEIERLSRLTAPTGGRRRSLIVHPRAEEPGLGLAPGIQVAIEVLLPGEETVPIRHNSSIVSFCIVGRGETTIDRQRFSFGQYDVICVPSMAIYRHRNDSGDRQVRLTYSNAALLEKMNVHIVEECPVPPWGVVG